jgi:hypothetical protein
MAALPLGDRLNHCNLTVKPNMLLVFVDEVGHEALAPGHDKFGLGGCAVMGRDYQRLIVRPWRRLRRMVNGSPDAPLHATEFTRQRPRPEHLNYLSWIFQSKRFMRFAAVATRETAVPDGLNVAMVVYQTLGSRVVDIVRWTNCTEVAIIFERSHRGDPVTMRYFSEFGIEERGMPIPVSLGLMPKSLNECGLEVADFVMHAVSGQVQRRLKNRSGFGRDFQSIFHHVPRKLVSFMVIERCSRPVEIVPAERS